MYPLDTVKTRLQALPTAERPEEQLQQPLGELTDELKMAVKRKDVKGVPRSLLSRLRRWEMLNMLLRIIKTEGLAGVFKGFSANMINTFSQRTQLSLLSLSVPVAAWRGTILLTNKGDR